MRRLILSEENASPIEPTKVHQGTGKTVLNVPRHEVIDADTLQAAAEIALGRVV